VKTLEAKLLGVLVLLCVGGIAVATALGQPQETNRVTYKAISVQEITQFRKQVSLKRAKALPPLRLPNISALTAAAWKADRATLNRQLSSSKNVIAFWNGKGRWIRAPRAEKCWDVPWQRSCTVARASLRLHTALAKVAETRLTRELPYTNDWRTAVRLVQRIYPGTADWMLYISHREGGYGPWVWYGGRTWSGYHIGNDFLGADTVGGWMQFRYSTFAPYWRQAQADLKRRGIIVPFLPMPPEGGPTQYAAWLSPLGQALTAGYMKYYGKEGCHWCL
jgi:hypothetical protein